MDNCEVQFTRLTATTTLKDFMKLHKENAETLLRFYASSAAKQTTARLPQDHQPSVISTNNKFIEKFLNNTDGDPVNKKLQQQSSQKVQRNKYLSLSESPPRSTQPIVHQPRRLTAILNDGVPRLHSKYVSKYVAQFIHVY